MLIACIKRKNRANSPQLRREKLSNLLPAGFSESNLTLQGGIPRAIAETYIQPFLNGGGCELIWDLKVAISSPLYLESNTKIIAFVDTGAIVSNGSDKPIFMNKNIVFANNANIIDQNILIYGGVWHGNNGGQNTKGTATHGLATIMSFHGCKNTVVANNKFYEPMTYCIMSNNMLNCVYEDIYIDVGVNTNSNKDGVHFDGYSKNCRISRLNVRTLDDAIGLNTNDAYFESFNNPSRTFTEFYDASMNGPISDIVVEDIYFNDSIFGIRILSSISEVSNITIRRFRGKTGQYAILIDNFQNDKNWTQPWGRGNFKNIFIDDIDVIISDRWQWRLVDGSPKYAVMNIAANVDNLQATNVQPSRNPKYPLLEFRKIAIDNVPYVYNNVVINGISYN